MLGCEVTALNRISNPSNLRSEMDWQEITCGRASGGASEISAAAKASSKAGSPCASTNTSPVRFCTTPLRPKRSARLNAKARYPTPCTRPPISQRRASSVVLCEESWPLIFMWVTSYDPHGTYEHLNSLPDSGRS